MEIWLQLGSCACLLVTCIECPVVCALPKSDPFQAFRTIMSECSSKLCMLHSCAVLRSGFLVKVVSTCTMLSEHGLRRAPGGTTAGSGRATWRCRTW